MKTKIIIIVLASLLIITWANICKRSYKATIYQSFQIKDITLQRLDTSIDKENELYLVDIEAKEQNPKESWSHTSPFLNGISEPLKAIRITNENGKVINDLFVNPYTDINKENYLVTQYPKTFFSVGHCLTIKQLKSFINSAKSEIGDFCGYDKNIHICHIFKYPKNEPLPQDIYLYFNKRKIKGHVYNRAIGAHVEDEPY